MQISAREWVDAAPKALPWRGRVCRLGPGTGFPSGVPSAFEADSALFWEPCGLRLFLMLISQLFYRGHGDCNMGFCKCHPGWYGIDCSRKRKGLAIEAGDEEGSKPWLKDVMTPVPAGLEPPPSPTRKRPFVYVYDTWPEFNTDVQQYRCAL